MPKIAIKEYDKTNAGFISENNFTVAIPGFCKDGVRATIGTKDIYYGQYDDGTSIFDENGIYTCTSLSDFETYVGKFNAQNTEIEAVAPTFVTVTEGETTKELWHTNLSAEEFYRTYENKVYIYTEITEESEKQIGYLKEKRTIESVDHYYKYTKITSGWDSTTDYSVIDTGNEGTDASSALYQYGNQMADLLLGIGYNILYIKLDKNNLMALQNASFWASLKDRALYDFRYILSGLINNCSTTGGVVTVDAVNKCILNVATHVNANADDGNGRGDCIGLLDISKDEYAGLSTETAIANIKAKATGGNEYTAYFAPTVFYGGVEDSEYGYNNEFPASMHYLVCAANSTSRYPEWFAVSGYSRGSGTYSVVGTSVKLGDAAVNTLQPRTSTSSAVNLIINLNDSYYLWGNRTGYVSSSGLVASSFLNIRQLCCTLKKTIYNTCRNLMFDPNSEILWLNFCNGISPTLEKMKANQGIKDYKFEQKESSLKAKLFAVVRIIPIEAVEDFEIGITLEDNFDSTTISIDEHN